MSSLLLTFAHKRDKSRKYVYELLHTPTIDSKMEQIVKAFLAFLIILSVVAVALETIPEYELRYKKFFSLFEIVTISIFTFEYLLRVWSITESPQFSRPVVGRLRYICTFMALTDLVALLPFYLPAMIAIDLRFIRAIRLLKFVRLLKLGAYSNSLTILTKVLKKKRYDIAVSLAVILILVVIFSCLLYYLEHDAQPTIITDIPMTVWWGIAKLTGLGYVEVIPSTAAGKVCDAVLSFLGLSFFALPSGILATGFIEEIEKKGTKQACPHCGEEIIS